VNRCEPLRTLANGHDRSRNGLRWFATVRFKTLIFDQNKRKKIFSLLIFILKIKKNLQDKSVCAAFSGKDPYFAQRKALS
jgi:hypothetical protein